MQKTKKFWSYEFSQQQEIKQESLDNFKLKGRFYDDLAGLYYEFLGSPPHPSLKQPYGKEHTEPNIISFLNILIDINTLKMFFHVIPNSKIITLKLSSNNFEFNNFDFLINGLLHKNNNVFSFIFEWNSEFKHEGKQLSININSKNYIKDPNLNISTKENQNQINKAKEYSLELREIINKYEQNIIKLSTSTKIEALCLRGNFIGDENAKIFFENMKNNQSLKILNLYKNNLSSEIMKTFCEMLEINKKLEEINLGGNNLKDEDLVMIKNSLGKIELNSEEIESYLRRFKDREVILEKNKKLKAGKKPEEAVPYIEEVLQQGESYFLMKNTKLRSFNLMQNSFTEECFDTIIAILELNQDLLLTIDNKLFSTF